MGEKTIRPLGNRSGRGGWVSFTPIYPWLHIRMYICSLWVGNKGHLMLNSCRKPPAQSSYVCENLTQ